MNPHVLNSAWATVPLFVIPTTTITVCLLAYNTARYDLHQYFFKLKIAFISTVNPTQLLKFNQNIWAEMQLRSRSIWGVYDASHTPSQLL